MGTEYCKTMDLYWSLYCTINNRINKPIAIWATAKASSQCKNWFYFVCKQTSDWQMNTDININQTIGYNIVQN